PGGSRQAGRRRAFQEAAPRKSLATTHLRASLGASALCADHCARRVWGIIDALEVCEAAVLCDAPPVSSDALAVIVMLVVLVVLAALVAIGCTDSHSSSLPFGASACRRLVASSLARMLSA